MEQDNAKQTSASQGRENPARGIWGEQEECGDFDNPQCDRGVGFTLGQVRHQPQRTSGEVREGNDFTPGGETFGGTLSQLVEDCKEQIAGNNQIIDTLQSMNQSLEEKIDFYQRLLKQINVQE
ncbi:hypothetical protein Ava_D0042 [Trichormus variabilis ATCC 29413]|uniref:Uncharacterized protein n=1 Tax=Trichormus variabilis (strain ATCC 29413 / PCC 7937) TaxID=240292 RepID=Q3M2S9_TRIV2|nr:hypothetical protein [Trichormus variabilis]ABA24707.1 hypothetical protein Ava_D0042 [Trichormus variabilis ATCC 29413]